MITQVKLYIYIYTHTHNFIIKKKKKMAVKDEFLEETKQNKKKYKNPDETNNQQVIITLSLCVIIQIIRLKSEKVWYANRKHRKFLCQSFEYKTKKNQQQQAIILKSTSRHPNRNIRYSLLLNWSSVREKIITNLIVEKIKNRIDSILNICVCVCGMPPNFSWSHRHIIDEWMNWEKKFFFFL